MYKRQTNIGDKRGLNAMTISELTGIPRPTVIRKLKILLKQKDIQVIATGSSPLELMSKVNEPLTGRK